MGIEQFFPEGGIGRTTMATLINPKIVTWSIFISLFFTIFLNIKFH